MPSIQSFLSRYLPHEEPKPPPITAGTAAVLLVIYTLVYVLPFYLSAITRPSRSLSRDAPSVIRARITSVTLTCVICSVSTFVILTSNGNASNTDALHSMGYWPSGLFETAKSLLLTAVLFVGPLYETIVVHEAWRDLITFQPISDLFNEWTTWRNIVAGPFTEEVLFRSAAVPLMLLAQTSVTKTIFMSPLIFGLAHLHHFYEFRLSQPQVPVSAALLRSLFQLTYTSLFGAYATFLFLRTGSLLAIFVVHAFCNCMGFPRFWGRVEPSGASYGARSSVAWTVVYYVLLVVGAGLWWKNLGVLTESANQLVPVKV
ncbi:CaaX protease [Pseudomassariella vexata]|uniref:intramembrane prenyl-peptidase Rce1 n=1 Tax=Pseudomassariella vexata TaxID=1141098 RepID=A0A1Y2ED40_9PEZI|nr:CaaX protease [Pseudomassariella vexata]ORY69488.1 CaaX protease [Pseudomassariella vexata]